MKFGETKKNIACGACFRRSMLAGMLALLLSFILSPRSCAQVVSGTTADGFIYSGSNSQLTITGYTSALSGSVTTPVIINVSGTDMAVIAIGMSAFQFASKLTSVTISDGVRTIGSQAFAFTTGLATVTIPGTVTSLGVQVFWQSTGLSGVWIPSSVTSIGWYAFAGCTNLGSIGVDPANPNYSSSADGVLFDKNQKTLIQAPAAMTGAYTIPNSVTSLAIYAFEKCSGLTAITIPGTITAIPDSAFHYCSGLTSITIPDSVKSIGGYAFQYCTGLTSVTMPDGLTSIGDQAFNNCSKLTAVTIPAGVTSIGLTPCEYCSNLTAINVSGSNIAYSSPDGVLLDKTQKTLIECPQAKSGAYTIPNSVTGIGNYAFFYCGNLTGLTMPNGVRSIGSYAFYRCTRLPNFTIPESVTTIGSYAFQVCSALTSINIPAAVTSIGTDAFRSTGLNTVVFTGTAPTMGTSVFASVSSGFTVYYFPGAAGFASPQWTDSAGDKYAAAEIAAPAGLSAVSGSAIGQISLKWSVAPWARTYLLQRSTAPDGGFAPVTTVSSGTSYIDSDPALVAGETYYYEIAGALSGGTSSYSTPASAAPSDPPTYAGWSYYYFGLNAPASQTGDTACPAGDGNSNLMKYALGLNPNVSCGTNSPGVPCPGMTSGTQPCLTLSFTGTAADVTYSVQTTGDLNGGWTTLQTWPAGSPPGTVIVSDTIPVSSATKRFLRLQVTRP